MKLPDFDLRLFLPKPPHVLIAVVVLGVVGSWVPLSLFLKHRFSFHDQPRVHLWQDMDNQPKLKAQAPSPLFTDGRAMRPPVPGTVARGHLADDDHLSRGFVLVADGDTTTTQYLAGFPDALDVDEPFVLRGQQQYDVMCSVCHGLDGRGNGIVNQRAAALMANKNDQLKLGTAWTPAANLVGKNQTTRQLLFGPNTYPEGKLFNTITHGKGNMSGYGHALSVQDRWAIVAYIRALQLSQSPGALDTAAASPETPGSPEKQVAAAL